MKCIKGVGLVKSTRGLLEFRVKIDNSLIAHYQMITPTAKGFFTRGLANSFSETLFIIINKNERRRSFIVAKLFANLYDTFMGPLEKRWIAHIRRKIVSGLEGNILEIGAGSGANFPFYSTEKVSSITTIEPNPFMLDQARRKAVDSGISVHFHQGVAESLPFKDGEFDTVVATLVLCSVEDPKKVFQEIRRVCKKGGRIVLFEHVRTDSASLAALQDVLTPAWKRLCDGCHLNRDTGRYMKESGIKVIKEKKYLKGIFVELEGANPE
jgi:ubiquinone/menaquinone biosynthesis C-methylase UbiE